MITLEENRGHSTLISSLSVNSVFTADQQETSWTEEDED